ncbi:hypothetical protein QBC44DRAFT_313089 [Cladorrhinum sp. PSN332]|nr:hypothetical protein QBC44DRAFT_313089 [Cladorrhinum sp. PSN332]
MCLRIALHFACRKRGCQSQGRSRINFNHVRKCADFPIETPGCLAQKCYLPKDRFLPIECWDHILPDIHESRQGWESAVTKAERAEGARKLDEVDSETRRYVSEYGDSRLACLYHHWLTVVRYYAQFGPSRKEDVFFPMCTLTEEYCRGIRTAVEIWKSNDSQVGAVVGIPEGSFLELQSPAFKRFFCHWRTCGPNQNEQYPSGTIDFPGYAGDPGFQAGVGGRTWGKYFKSFEFPRGPSAPLRGEVHRYFAYIDRNYSEYRDYGVVQPSSWYEEEQWRNRQKRGPEEN